MYVCICNAIKESELRRVAAHVGGTAEDIYISLGRAPQCRQCLDDAEAIVIDARAATYVPACVTD